MFDESVNECFRLEMNPDDFLSFLFILLFKILWDDLEIIRYWQKKKYLEFKNMKLKVSYRIVKHILIF